AEDGIRDLIVTGVQTCALPICPPHTADRTGATVSLVEISHHGHQRSRRSHATLSHGLRSWRAARRARSRPEGRLRRDPRRGDGRSEERRVGKEGRKRWWAECEE